MTQTQSPSASPTGTKPINLAQLEGEINTAGVATSGISMANGYVFQHDAEGQPIDFAVGDQAAVNQCISAHVAMRDKTDAEYATEFQNPNTTVARKQEIRDITSGLLPREQVPVDTTKSSPAHSPPPPTAAHAHIESASDLEQLRAALLEAIP